MLTIQRLTTSSPQFQSELDRLLAFESGQDAAIERTVEDILLHVRRDGDAAVLEYTKRFDRLDVASMAQLELPVASLHAALNNLPQTQRDALEAAAARVRAYHEHQVMQSWT